MLAPMPTPEDDEPSTLTRIIARTKLVLAKRRAQETLDKFVEEHGFSSRVPHKLALRAKRARTHRQDRRRPEIHQLPCKP